MESSKATISSLDTAIAYIEYDDFQQPEGQKKAIDSLRNMRFLILKNVPGVKEMQQKVYESIYDLPKILQQNPHQERKDFNNRIELPYTIYPQEDNTFSPIPDERDSDELKEFKENTVKFSNIKAKVIQEILKIIDEHMQKIVEERYGNNSKFQSLRDPSLQKKERLCRSFLEKNYVAYDGYSTIRHKDCSILTVFPCMKFWKDGKMIEQPPESGLFIVGPNEESIRIESEEGDLGIQSGMVLQILSGKEFQGSGHFVPQLQSTDIYRANHIEFFNLNHNTVLNPPFEPETALMYNENEFKQAPEMSYSFYKRDMKLSELMGLQYKNLIPNLVKLTFKEVDIGNHKLMVLTTPWAPSVLKKSKQYIIKDKKIYVVRADYQPKMSTYKSTPDNLHFAILFLRTKDKETGAVALLQECQNSIKQTLEQFGVANASTKNNNQVLINDKIVAVIKLTQQTQDESTKIIIPIEVGLNAGKEVYESFPSYSSIFLETSQKIGIDEFFENFISLFLNNFEAHQKHSEQSTPKLNSQSHQELQNQQEQKLLE